MVFGLFGATVGQEQHLVRASQVVYTAAAWQWCVVRCCCRIACVGVEELAGVLSWKVCIKGGCVVGNKSPGRPLPQIGRASCRERVSTVV